MFESNKTKGPLNKRAKIGNGHLCLREENLSFNTNYMYISLEL